MRSRPERLHGVVAACTSPAPVGPDTLRAGAFQTVDAGPGRLGDDHGDERDLP